MHNNLWGLWQFSCKNISIFLKNKLKYFFLINININRYYDSFIESDSIHIVMEYAEGGTLNDKIMEYK